MIAMMLVKNFQKIMLNQHAKKIAMMIAILTKIGARIKVAAKLLALFMATEAGVHLNIHMMAAQDLVTQERARQ